ASGRPEALEPWGDQAVHPLHWPHQFDLRLHDLLRYALGLQVLGPFSRTAVPDRLVCRVAHDADAHHPRHSHQQGPFPGESREPCADGHDVMHHGVRSLASVLSRSFSAGLRSVAWALLADPGAHAARLYGPDTNDQSLAAAQEVDLAARL